MIRLYAFVRATYDECGMLIKGAHYGFVGYAPRTMLRFYLERDYIVV